MLKRQQHGERAYRLTGAGLYRDSVLAGADHDIPQSVISKALAPWHSGAIGQDTVMVTQFKGRLFWTFGDTACPRSARQNNCDNTGMYTVGATSCAPNEDESCNATDPPNLQYFAENVTFFRDEPSDGRWPSPKPMAPFPPLAENTWLAALTVIGRGTPEESLY